MSKCSKLCTWPYGDCALPVSLPVCASGCTDRRSCPHSTHVYAHGHPAFALGWQRYDDLRNLRAPRREMIGSVFYLFYPDAIWSVWPGRPLSRDKTPRIVLS